MDDTGRALRPASSISIVNTRENGFGHSVNSRICISALNKFLCTFDEIIAVFTSLQIPDLGDFLIFSIAFRAIPNSSHRLFEISNTDEYPRARDLFKFIKGRIQVLELAGAASPAGCGKPFAAKIPTIRRDWMFKDKPATSLVVSIPEEDTALRVMERMLSEIAQFLKV